jgi:NAD(P)-dependent dehydrogenase (short-subunit alcohol dehydrogenase family)
MNYLEQLFSLKGKTAIISGGAGAIGLVMSEALLKAGANIVVWSRTQESIDKACSHLDGIDETAGRVLGTQVDAGVEEQVEKALQAADNHFGGVDLLVNGVGGNIGKSSFIETNMETFQKVLHMNLVAGLMIPTKVVAAWWIEKKTKGAIINLTSMASYNPLSGVWAYDAAKSATLNLTMAAANEFARYGIRVNAIAPGFFIGKQNKALLINQETGEYTDRGESVIAHTPYGRFGDVQELAGATLFLASERASGFVTGVSIPVDGGYLAHNI